MASLDFLWRAYDHRGFSVGGPDFYARNKLVMDLQVYNPLFQALTKDVIVRWERVLLDENILQGRIAVTTNYDPYTHRILEDLNGE